MIKHLPEVIIMQAKCNAIIDMNGKSNCPYYKDSKVKSIGKIYCFYVGISSHNCRHPILQDKE